MHLDWLIPEHECNEKAHVLPCYSKKSPRGIWMLLHVNGAPGQGMHVNRGTQGKNGGPGGCTQVASNDKRQTGKGVFPSSILLSLTLPLWTESGLQAQFLILLKAQR